MAGRKNVLPNPSAAVNTTGWVSGGTITRLTGLSGTPRATGGSVTFTGGAFTNWIGSPRVAAAAGQTWTAVCWVRASAARNVNVGLQVWDASNIGGAEFGTTTVALAANTWTQVRITGTLSGSFTTVNVQCDGPSGWVSGNVMSLSSVRLEQVTDAAMVYADGDTVGWVWDGTAGSSSSQESSGTTTALGRTNETDTARALTAGKDAASGRTSEADTARAVIAGKAAGLAAAGELGGARALTHTLSAALAAAAETDGARPLTAAKTTALTATGETGGAGVLTWSHTIELGAAGETTGAGQLTESRGLGAAVDTSGARPLTAAKTAALLPAAEVAGARPLTESNAATVAAVAEIDGARALAAAKTTTVTAAAESEFARPLTPGKATTLGAVDDSSGVRGLVGEANRELAAVADVSGLRPLAAGKVYALGRTGDVAGAGALGVDRSWTLGPAADTSTARALATATKTASLAAAAEAAGARLLDFSRIDPISRTGDTAGARPLGSSRAFTLGRVGDAEQLRPWTSGKQIGLSPAGVEELARRITAEAFGTLGRVRDVQGTRPLVALGSIRPALTPTLFAIDKTTGERIPLPKWSKLKLSPQVNSQGALSVGYASGAPGFDLLHDSVGAQPLRVLELEIWLGGNSDGALGGFLVQKAGDRLTPGDEWTFDGHFMEWLLSKALVGPQAITEDNPKGELVFAAVTYGTMLITVVQQAQTRGALDGITWDFTTTHDSNGQPWASNVTNLKFSPAKATVAQVAEKGVELQLGEFELTRGRVLRAYNPGTRGVDRTTGGFPLRFQHAVNLSEHSRRQSARDAGSAVLAAGGEGNYAWATDDTAEATLGFRTEVAADAGNIDTDTGVVAFAEAQAEILSKGIAEYQSGVELKAGELRPFLDYGVADWGYAVTGTERLRLRIAQIEATWQTGQPAVVNVVQNDVVTDAVAALYRRLNSVTSGDAVVGTSTATPVEDGPDTMPPAAPTGLVVSSNTAYQLPGQAETLAEVTVGWSPVTTNADATAADDIDRYRVRYAYLGPNQVGGLPSSTPDGDPLGYYEPVGSPTAGLSLTWGEVTANVEVGVQVAAIDRNGNQGEWSARLDFTTQKDNEAPPTLSTPVQRIWFRTLDSTWDGFGAEGETMPGDFLACQVWLARAAAPVVDPTQPVTQFDPAQTEPQHVADLFTAGTWNQPDLPVGVGWYTVFVAVDLTGNASGQSAVAGPVMAEQLVSQDLIDDIIDANKLGPDSVENQHVVNGAITTAKIVDANIVRAKIADLAVNDAKIESLSVGKIVTGTLNATVTLTGIIKTLGTLHWEGDSAGIRFYNSSGVKTIDLQGASGSALITGVLQSGLTGERWRMETDGTLRLYPSAGTNYSQIANLGNDLMIRGILDSNSRSGRINVNALGAAMNFSAESEIPTNMRSEMIVTDRQARTTAPLIVLELNGKLSVPSGSNRRLELRATNSSGVALAASLLYYTARSGDNLPTWGSNNSGLLFDSKVIVTTGDASVFGAIGAASYDPPSSGTVKDNITDARAILDPLGVIRAAKSQAWNYTWEHFRRPAPTEEDPNPEPVPVEAPVRFGPLAEDLPEVLRTEVKMPDGSGTVAGVSLGSQIGVLWAAIGQIITRQQRVAVGRATLTSGTWLAGTTREVEVAWDQPPLALPGDGAVTIYAPIAWLGRTNAWVKPGSTTLTGCTVVVQVLAAVSLSSANPITYDVQAPYDYFPPYAAPE